MSGPAQAGPGEAAVTVNGRQLTRAQAMTVRVALEGMEVDLACHGLGDDDQGRAMTKGYLAAGREIRGMMAQG